MPAEPRTQSNEAAYRQSSKGRPLLMVLFSATIFMSAALLFLVEPMFAKFVLPSFGGTPAVWTGSMMFFQAALLASYLYVHLTTRWLGARRQAILHLVVVLLPLLVLPLAVPAEDWAPPAGSNPLFWLLGLLAVAVGLPFFAISATNPLIQRWLADTDHPAAKDPYFLYRASNLGSVIGLLGYPLVVERELTLTNQGFWWTAGYGVLVVLVFASAVLLWRSNPAPAAQEEEPEPLAGDPVSGGGSPQSADPSLGEPASGSLTILRRLRWVGLTFVPSSLMLGVTAFITTDITPIPLLWVIPLSLYLFSFVVVFSPGQRMPDLIHKVMVAALPLVLTVLVVTILAEMSGALWFLVPLHLLAFFLVAMVLHGEVARDRPPARHLTEFYLWVAVGGMMGGVFNALVAPLVFDTVIEYPLMIVLACMFVPGLVLSRLIWGGRRGTGANRRALRWPDLALPLAVGVALWVIGWSLDEATRESIISPVTNLDLWQYALGGFAGVVCVWFAYVANRPIRFGLSIAALMITAAIVTGSAALNEDRSFFGVYRVTGEQGNDNAYHALVVGNTNHGAQLLGPQPPVPIAYHDPTSPIGQLFNTLPDEATSEPVAVLGLGTGAMFCYSKSGQQWDFYEIDPAVEEIARNEELFTYLSDCPGQSDVVLGDARLRLAEAPDGEYGMVVGDAFSSDAIPVHLVTREAMDLYVSKLKSDGVMIMHISNRHLELEPVVGDLARDAGLVCYSQFDDKTEGVLFKQASHWAVMARERDDLGDIAYDSRWQSCESNPDYSDTVWTDDFSNLLSTFDWE